jgi:hypothetical protein
MSPIIADKSELFPEPTSPITHTNSPFLTLRLTFLRVMSESTLAEPVSIPQKKLPLLISMAVLSLDS